MSRWNNSMMEAARHRTDPAADQVARELFSTDSIADANRLFSKIQHNEGGVPNDGPPVLQDWLRRSAALPSWYDRKKALAGQELFQRNGLAIVAALFNRALPETYLGAKGVQVLHLTHQLTKDPVRRILETAQLVFDVCEPNAFEAGERGVRTCQKVRLVHSGVRYLLKTYPGMWKKEWDEPVNQEDQAGTIQAFGGLTLQALEKMGLDFNVEEAVGYMHLWKVVGHLLGVEDQFLTDDYEEGKELIELIARRQFRPTPEGKALTRALLQAEADLLPSTLADGAAPFFMRWLTGDRYADMLDIPRYPLSGLVTGPLSMLGHLVDEAGDNSRFMAAFYAHFNRALMHGLTYWNLRNRKVEFRISPAISAKWGLQR